MDYFRRFFGLGDHNRVYEDEWSRQFSNNSNGSFFHNDEVDGSDGQNIFSFNVFTNPLEMHSYFEHKMNEFMKQFGMGENFMFGNQFPEFPAIEGGSEQERPFRSLRDHYLKPGYHTTDESSKNCKVDQDVDGKVTSEDLDSLFIDKAKQEVTPYQPRFKSQLFGQSVISRTIQKPDGTLETHRTIRNHDGSEETTVTRKRNDQEYTIVTKKDKNGQEERTENFINLDEKDINLFLQDIPNNTPQHPNNWFDFDKYFK